MRNALAAGAGVATTIAVVYYISAAATFGMDAQGSIGDIPGPLWLLSILCGLTLGFCVFQVIKRR